MKRKPLIVLRMEDHAHNGLEVLNRELNGAVTLMHVSTNAAVLSYLRDHDCDLILCAVSLDEESVFDLLRAVRLHDRTAVATMPFVCFRPVTSEMWRTIDQGSRRTAALLGANAYLDIDEIVAQPGLLQKKIAELLWSEDQAAG